MEAYCTRVIIEVPSINKPFVAMAFAIIVCCIIPNVTNIMIFHKTKVILLLKSRVRERLMLWLK